MISSLEYIWHRLPMILMFSNSYLVYRMLVHTQLTEFLVQKAFMKSQGDFCKLIVLILVSGALMSFFIPNAVTALILLPMLKQIKDQLGIAHKKAITALALAAIYGTNIGGMGSLVGSPANLVLIGALDFFNGGKELQITFFNWFLWSIPLVICFLGCAFLVIRYIALPLRISRLKWEAITPNQLNNQQRQAMKLFTLFLIFWIMHAILKQRFLCYQQYQSYVCLAFIGYFMIRMFIRPNVITCMQLLQGIPFRGCSIIILVACIMLLIRYFNLDNLSVRYLDLVLPKTTSSMKLVCWVTTISIFLTEFFSNTIVSTVMFPIVYQTAQMNGLMPLMLMIPVSVASTCAFMTPIATPCNAFVYGELREISLRAMLLCGFLLNVLCVLCVTCWLPICIPLVYS